jgi:hypothetical protein
MSEVKLPSGRYELRSSRLHYSQTTLSYNDGVKNHEFDLAEIYLPATAAHPATAPLSDYPNYVDIVLSAADLRISRAKRKFPEARAITRQIYLIRNVLDWLRMRGVYHLADASTEDTNDLLAQFAEGGWATALRLDERWDRVLSEITTDELLSAFHFEKRDSTLKIDSMRVPFWNQRLGMGGNLMMTAKAKTKLQELIAPWPQVESLQHRRESDGSAPTQSNLQNHICWLNDLFALPGSVDRFTHRVSSNPTLDSRRLAQKQSSRTENLSLDDAVTLLKRSFHLLYEVAPLLIAFYNDAHFCFTKIPPGAPRQNWLLESQARMRLEEAVGRPIQHWTWSGHQSRKEDSHTIEEVLAAVQGACAIILAAMNARRQMEICDRHLGLRSDDLIVLDDELGLFQCHFYIAKSYQDRHRFYVNRASADAFRCLTQLKALCMPITDGSHKPSTSIFACGKVTTSGKIKESNFEFSSDHKRTRSLSSFFKIVYANDLSIPDVASHMFRRFYSILYFHRYEHAELRALRQHLRHLEVAMTRVYVTDPSTRELATQIQTTIGRSAFRIADNKLRESLDESATQLDRALIEMSEEKLFMAVEQILSGAPTAGGFSRIVRKLYRQLQSRIAIAHDISETPARRITQLLDMHGYQVNPMLHGQCHAPDQRRQLKAACQHDGLLEREHASPKLCGGCPFHFNNAAYVVNLEEQLVTIDSERHDFLLSPLQQARAEVDYQNLSRIITLTKHEMSDNAQAMANLSGHEKDFAAK